MLFQASRVECVNMSHDLLFLGARCCIIGLGIGPKFMGL